MGWLLVLWGVGMALSVPLFGSQIFLFRRLRHRHPATWRDLGEPTLFNLSLRTQRATHAFLSGDGPRRLGDPGLLRWVRWQRLAGWLWLALALPWTLHILWSLTTSWLEYGGPVETSPDTPPATPLPANTSDELSPLAWALVGLWAVSCLSLSLTLLHRLRRHHTELWRQLGEPAFFSHNTPRNQLALTRFLLSGRHQETGDLWLSVLVWASRLVALAILPLFLL